MRKRTLIHIHDESRQDMDSCNTAGIEGQKQQTKQLQTGKEMEKHWNYCWIFQKAGGAE